MPIPALTAVVALDPVRSQLAWRCRRGMKELDLLLLRWLESAFDGASAEQRRLFAALLELPDPQLARYLIGGERPGDGASAALIAVIAAVMSIPAPGTLTPPAGPTVGSCVPATEHPRQPT